MQPLPSPHNTSSTIFPHDVQVAHALYFPYLGLPLPINKKVFAKVAAHLSTPPPHINPPIQHLLYLLPLFYDMCVNYMTLNYTVGLDTMVVVYGIISLHFHNVSHSRCLQIYRYAVVLLKLTLQFPSSILNCKILFLVDLRQF